MAPRMVAENEAGSLAGVYGEIRTRLGVRVVPNVFKAMAAVSHDVLMQNWTAFRETFLEGVLPRTVKEMIGLVVSRECGNEYAMKLHSHNLLHLGVATAVVRGLREHGDSAELPEPVRAMLVFARDYSHNPDGTHGECLEAAGLTEDDVQEVMDTVLIVTGITRFADECGIPCDGD